MVHLYVASPLIRRFFGGKKFNIKQSHKEDFLVVSLSYKGQTISKANCSVLNSSKKQTKLTRLSKDDTPNSELHLFLGRIEGTINCLRDLLTFKVQQSKANFQNISELAI